MGIPISLVLQQLPESELKMPPNVRNVNDVGTGVSSWYFDQPPITRTYATCIVVATLLSFVLQILQLSHIALLWPSVYKKFEIWRLVTNFFILAKPSFKLVVYILWIISYMMPLERETFRFEPADYLYMLLVNASMINIFALFMPSPFNGLPLILSCVYIWSRNFRDANVSLYGLVTVKAFYLPFAFAAMSMVLGDSVIPDLVGIGAGHLYYFFKELYPRTSGRNILVTPNWLKQKCADWGLGAPPPTVDRAAAAADLGFRPFVGRGQRLGD